MTWAVEFEDEFEAEFDEFVAPIKTELLTWAQVLAQFGPTLDRYIKAIGSKVSIVAEFPERPPVKLTFDEMSKELEVERDKPGTDH